MNGCTIYIHSEAMFVKARGGAASWLVPKCCVLWTQNCSRRRRSQCCFSSISEQAMHESIERSQLRKKKKLSDRVGCPGCSQKSLAPKSLLSHMTRCCPDLIHDQHVRSPLFHCCGRLNAERTTAFIGVGPSSCTTNSEAQSAKFAASS